MPVFVTRATLPPIEEYMEEIRMIWDTHWLTNMGPKHKELETKLKSYLGVDNIELVTNGHMALELTLQAMDLKGEVITTPFTFASTTHAIVRNGLEPVFCDIDPDTYTLDAGKIEPLITERTCAILPVHVYGNLCDVDAIDRIAKKYHLRVIYDAAHTFGETLAGRGVGSFGDASCFSFHATKVFNSIEGGAVTFADPTLGKRLYRLKNFGIEGPESVVGIGANAKMNEFCAAMGLCNLRHVDEEIAKRRRVVERYQARLNGVPGLRLNAWQREVRHNYGYFPVQIEPAAFGRTRDEVFAALAAQEIHARKYFYPLTNDLECFRGRFDASLTPVAKRIAAQILTLPLYAGLALEDVDQICDVILQC